MDVDALLRLLRLLRRSYHIHDGTCTRRNGGSGGLPNNRGRRRRQSAHRRVLQSVAVMMLQMRLLRLGCARAPRHTHRSGVASGRRRRRIAAGCGGRRGDVLRGLLLHQGGLLKLPRRRRRRRCNSGGHSSIRISPAHLRLNISNGSRRGTSLPFVSL